MLLCHVAVDKAAIFCLDFSRDVTTSAVTCDLAVRRGGLLASFAKQGSGSSAQLLQLAEENRQLDTSLDGWLYARNQGCCFMRAT
jgi:hypothetical protein